MIEVRIGKTSLCLHGHAGFAEYGSDIVCAAASMLAFALAAGIEELQPENPPLVTAKKGSFRLEVAQETKTQEQLAGMFAVIRAGYALLARQYPENVQVLSEKL